MREKNKKYKNYDVATGASSGRRSPSTGFCVSNCLLSVLISFNFPYELINASFCGNDKFEL